MGLGENTPLRGSDDNVPYVFMTDPNRAYKKKVRQLQCYLCSSMVAMLALALLVSITYTFNRDEEDELEVNGSLALNLINLSPKILNLEVTPASNNIDNNANDLKKKTNLEDGNDYSKTSPRISETSKDIEDLNICKSEVIKINCDKTQYSSITGLCNNLNNPLWGVNARPMKRLLQPEYCDGHQTPRCSLSKKNLPSPLEISSNLLNLNSVSSRNRNIVQNMWGQFIYQDLVGNSSYLLNREDSHKYECCGEKSNLHSQCFPIEASKGDSLGPHHNSTCINFIRSDYINCSNEVGREQLNMATSFLDASVIYGSSDETANNMRSFEKGQLSFYISSENELITINGTNNSECSNSKKNINDLCSTEGFKCLNQGLKLPSLNLIFAKQHNLIASQLSLINSHWTDEKLYQETRKIITGQIQHITYHEFLESLIGEEHMKTFGERSDKTGYYEEYDENIDPTISNSFASTAFKLVNIYLPENNKFPEHSGVAQRCKFYLIANHIQRGRDHGVPGYTRWREYCHLEKPKDFKDLSRYMGSQSANALQQLYQNVEDIDLFTGALLELPLKDNTIGPTGVCIISEQFKRIKTGDRFWYETSQRPQNLRIEQLAEIDKTTLSKVICDHTDMVTKIEYNIMKNSDDNPSLLCSAFPSLNLSFWIDPNEYSKANYVLIKNLLEPTTIKQSSDVTNNQLSKNNGKENGLAPDNILTFVKSANQFILQKSIKSNVTKKSTSFTVNIANITVSISNETVFEMYNTKPPITMVLDDIVDTSSYTPSANTIVSATFEEDILQGSLILPIKNNESFQKEKKVVEVNFTTDVSIKWGGSFDFNPKNKYKCKIMFQSYAKFSFPVNQKLLNTIGIIDNYSDEQCNILLIGTYYHRPFYCSITPWWCMEGLVFYWSGEAKLIFVRPATNILNKSNLNLIKTSLAQNDVRVLGKSENVIITKQFASVTVLKGKVSGQFNGEEIIDVMNGSPPIDIYYDNLVTPNSFDVGLQATWQANPIDDRSIVGTFSVPYYPTISMNSDRRTFTANFSVDFIYKYGGDIKIIDPSKTYTCKVMFQANKKSSNKLLLGATSVPVSIKGKTAFGESCSITISGSFQEPSVLCSLVPWWCSKEKVFHWNGDIELALKNKHNLTDNNTTNNLFKKDIETTAKKVLLNLDNSNLPINQGQFYGGHRFGSQVVSGWIKEKTGGIFSSSKTLWSGSLPFEIKMPLFWTPSINNEAELSNVYGHAVVWTSSMFHSAIQGSFSFPLYVSHGQTSPLKWVKGQFMFQLKPASNTLYDLIVPGVQYQSNIHFHNINSPNSMAFVDPKKGNSAQEEPTYGIRAPLILLGEYTPENKSFIWNGSFIIDITKTAKDLTYF